MGTVESALIEEIKALERRIEELEAENALLQEDVDKAREEIMSYVRRLDEIERITDAYH